MAIQGDVVGKALPVRTTPRWLDPSHVDVADPTEPLCWYGVPFVRKLLYPYTERMCLASYYIEQHSEPNRVIWTRSRLGRTLISGSKGCRGLQLDLNLVWE